MALHRGLAASELAQTQRWRVAAVVVALGVGALVLGPLAGSLVVADHIDFVVFLSALGLPVLFWKVPASPVIFLVAAATSVERFVDRGPDAIMAWIPLYRSFSETYSVSGGKVLPIELVFGLALLVWLARAIAERRRLTLPKSHISAALGVLVLASLLSEGYGLARGGIFNISMWELRPYVYLWLAYLLASQLLTGRAVFQAVLWGVVIGTGLKGLEGTERVITIGNVVPRPDAILEHDEAFFFSCFIVLTVALWVFGQRGYLRRVATLLLPLVVVADLGNNRRVAWIMLPAMLLALAVVAYVRIGERRKAIAWTVGALLVLSAGYVAVFRYSTSLIGTPAHAIWSQFNPDPRDVNSNLYRHIENVNLGLDIRSSPILGEGFGLPIAHPIPVYDVTDADPLINFIPHNNILYVWVRMGIFGMLAFWFLVGAAVIAACRLTGHQDRLLMLLGSVALAAMIAWLFEGWYDKGIVGFRVVILVGSLLGTVEAARSTLGGPVTPTEPEPKLVLEEDYEEGQRDYESIPSRSPQPIRRRGLQPRPARSIGRGSAEAG